MKPPRRQLAEIIDDAMELVRPVPAGKKSRRSAKETGVGSEQRRQLISYYMAAARGEPDGVPAFALDVSHADMRASLRTYVNLLRAARREPAAVLLSDYRILDARICRASALAKKYPVPSGSPPPNWAAVMAMADAKSILRALGMPAAKTVRGRWHKLAALCFEAATGVPNKDLSRHWRKPRSTS